MKRRSRRANARREFGNVGLVIEVTRDMWGWAPLEQLMKEICRAYDNLVEDSTRIQNRLKAIYRGRGIDCAGQALYRTDQRSAWLAKLSEEAARFRAESLLEQMASDTLNTAGLAVRKHSGRQVRRRFFS